MTNGMKLILILLLTLIVHTMTYEDEVAQQKINNQSATYAADHENQIGE